MTPGAVYYNCFYPGLIGVPLNSVFTVHAQGREVMLYVLRHLRPVVVTDFGNDFTHFQEGERRYLALKKPIPALNKDMLSLDVRTTAGETETIAAYGKEHEYVIYRRQAFTEITVGVEAANIKNHGVRADVILVAIDKFLALYRLMTHDMRLVPSDRLVRDFPIIRERVVPYSDFDPFKSRQQRLVDHVPKTFSPIIFSYKEYEQFLPVFHHDAADVASRLGHHLAVDTELKDARIALMDAFELLTAGRNPRFALVEAISIAEVISFDFLEDQRRKDERLNRRIRREEEAYRLTLRKAVVFLKEHLGETLTSFPELVPGLYKALNARDKTLHERAEVSTTEALAAINTVRMLLFAVEAYEEGSVESEGE